MPTTIDWNDRTDQWNRTTGSTHSFLLQRWPAWTLELADLHFHTDSAVVLPDAPLAEIEANEGPLAARLTLFSVLSEVLLQARDHPSRKLLVAGHADTQGNAAYNVTLSAKRSANVLQLLRNERDPWRNGALAKHVADDQRLILTWVATTWGWDCNPRVRGMYQAIKNFQAAYNDEFGASIGVDGDWRLETWGAVFDVYQRELAEVMDLDAAGLDDLRAHLAFVEPGKEAVGCGEHFPIEERSRDNFRSATNRRVELTFFEDPQKPELPCHPAADQCVPAACRFYHFYLYEPRFLTISPTTPRLARLPVHLRLTWRDPSGAEHPFPPEFPVELVYDDGASVRASVDANGEVDFAADKRKQWFTLRFPGEGSTRYVASLPADAPAGDDPPEAWSEEGALLDLRDKGYRFWRWPAESLDLTTSDWSVGDSAYDATDKRFTELATRGRIGARTARVPVALDPHWQYVKFLYHDRALRRTLSVPPLVLLGHADASAASADSPTTASNWTTPAEGCQAVPWVLRDPPKPDASIGLGFRSRGGTFVETTPGAAPTRTLVTRGDDPKTPLVSFGDDTDLHSWEPTPARLRYYDVPEVWKSALWHVKLSNGPGVAPSVEGRWEALAASATSDVRPLIFSLDDMVLTDDAQVPEAWLPNQRCAIFSNTFTAGANLGPTGVYKPDDANEMSYLTQLPTAEADRNYLADYPSWTRLVIANGMLYDVFSERVGEGADRPVGARAAVRWYPTTNPGTGHTTSPTTTTKNFVTVVRFYNHLNDVARSPGQVQEWGSGSTPLNNRIGRHDLAVLRCCDVDHDVEVALVLRYFGVDLDMVPTFTPAFNPNAVAMGLTGLPAARVRNAAVRAVANRWNGNVASEASFNPGVPLIVPKPATAKPFRARVMLFMQQVPPAQAHYQIGLFTDPTDPDVRAYMNSAFGTGALGREDTVASADGHYTAAHEFGHGLGLNDEYIESTTTASYRADGIRDSILGSPFAIDLKSMMESDHNVRARHFWHAAEQVRAALGASPPDLEVRHGARRYSLPSHESAPVVSFDSVPFAVDIDGTVGGISLFDLALFALGEDDWSAADLPAWVGGASATYDGILVVRLKLDVVMPAATPYTDMRDFAATFQSRVDDAFNKKFVARGTAGPRTFNRCLVYFTARVLGTTPPTDNATYLNAATSKNNATAADYANVVNPLRTGQRVHFTVTTRASGGSAWNPGRNLALDVSGSWPSAVPDVVADMLGVARASRTSPAAYATLVRRVIPGATVVAP